MKATRRGFLGTVAAALVAVKAVKVGPQKLVMPATLSSNGNGIRGIVDDGYYPQNISSVSEGGDFPIPTVRRQR